MTPTGLPVSHDVRIWAIQKYAGARRTTYTVRWLVAGGKFQRTFTTHKLAESFRASLLVAAGEGRPFDVAEGLPASLQPAAQTPTWFEHAVDYVEMKWPAASPRHRKGIAEALTTVTIAFVPVDVRPPDDAELRRALNGWAFNATAHAHPLPNDHAPAIEWIRRHSLPMPQLLDAGVLRRALHELSTNRDGRPSARSTVTRKRATLNNALEYAIERHIFDANPLRRLRLPLVKSDDAVDRRVVVNHTQARSLLAAVGEHDPAVEGFFACLYFAGLRPAEARNLRLTDCTLPDEGWGRAILTGSNQNAGAAWTDSGIANEERQLKHRSRRDTRPVPLHPELVETLRRHERTFQLGADGRLFVARTGKAGVPLTPPYLNPVSMDTIYRSWRKARQAALTPEQCASMLGRRPYDLRHACLSTWLNAGVPAAQVAEWAGHSIEVLLRVYSRCIDGQEEAALLRIDAALREP